MNRNTILAIAVALVVGLWAGFGVAHVGGGPGSLGGDRGFAGVPIRAADAHRPPPSHVEGMAFTRVRIDTTTAQPKACLEFSEDLSTDPQIHYADFLKISPAASVATEVVANQLCLAGLPYDPDHQVTIREGLPAKSGDRTTRDEQLTLAFGDRPAFVGFAGNGVVLPRTDADGLGIQTVNVSKLKIEVLRVSDRILSHESIDAGQAIAEGSWDWYSFESAARDNGSSVYKGELDVKLKDAGADHHNETLTTVFPLGSALKQFKPGAYVVKVQDASPGAGASGQGDRPAAAHRWILYTDMALQTFEGATGMDVVVRSLANARPVSGVAFTLIAANNDELARVRSDGEGRARFNEALFKGDGADKARYVMAYGPNGDFTALDLERPTLDLSDHAVDGRTQSGDVDAFMYTDRGIYRPGEVVRVGGLLRDPSGRAIENLQSTLVVFRPNGTEFVHQRLDVAKDAGAVLKNVWIDKSAPRGSWRAQLLVDGRKDPVGSVAFAVEDFVPQRLKVDVTADKRPLGPGQTRPIHVEARFLYGAPGAGLQVEGEARLQVENSPFPDQKGYSFGRQDENFEEKLVQLAPTTTDGEGKADLALAFTDPPQTSLPLRAKIVASVMEPGGRTVREGFDLPVRLSNLYLGVKPAFDGAHIDENAPGAFDLIAVDGAGQRASARQVSWQVVQEDWNYDWYQDNGQWKWRRTGRDIPVAGASGRIDLSAAHPVRISHDRFPEGAYRLVLKDDASGAETTLRFSAGWSWGGSQEETAAPDMVSVIPPPDAVKPGGLVHVEVKPPYAGEAQIVVASDRVLAMRTIHVGEKGAFVDLRADKSWGAGAYILVTVMTPRVAARAPVPRRAIGVAYARIDTSERQIKLDLASGVDKIRPRQTVNIPIVVTGAPRGEKVRLTLAAVDEGILGLTKFESPDPTKWYFGRKALGVGVRDDYGRLLNPNLAAASEPRQGGDQIGGEGLTVVPTKTVALWSGLVVADGSGKFSVPLNVPDFNGELRLMAVAWSETGLGAASKPLTVRDPVVAELTLPRFLAPGDEASATLELNNVDGPSGAYSVSVAAHGAASSAPFAQTFTLAQKASTRVRVPLRGAQAGLGKVTLSLSGPNLNIARDYDIQTRTSFLPVTDVTTETQTAGSAYTLQRALLTPFAPGEANVTVSFSNLRGLDPAPLLDVLDRYPYGCSEQLTSTAMPLLYANALAAAARKREDPRLRARLQEAVNKLLDRQSPDGAFGLWREDDREATPWLGAYITDFLRRAKAQGIVAPDAAMDLAYKGLRAVAKLDDFSSVDYNFDVYQWPGSNDTKELLKSRAAAYALYVLAKAGKVDVGQVRYFHDAKLKDEPSPLARAQIGAALAYLGDRARADDAFRKAEEALGYRNTGDYYQTPLRDVAGVLALAAEAGEGQLVDRLAVRLERMTPDATSLMTQEQAQLLVAADALLTRAGPVAISLNGAAPRALEPVLADAAAIERGMTFRNAGAGPVWRTLSAHGAPRSAPPPAARGFSIDKRYFTLAGVPISLASVKQGERIVVVISGAPEAQREIPAVLVDLLPAGLEIESALRPEDGQGNGEADQNNGRRDGPFAWAGRITEPRIAESRDDRFVAAVKLRGEGFKLGYIARAVTPGAFALPGAQIEDMYKPGVYGRTQAGAITVVASQ